MDLWNSIQQHLFIVFDDTFSRAALDRIYFKECQNDKLIILSAEDVFSKGLFEENCMEVISTYLKKIDKHYDFRVEILQSPRKKNTETLTEIVPTQQPAKTKHKKTVQLNKEFTMDNFIAGACNEFSYSFAKEIVSAPNSYNPFVIVGAVGTGKTHMAQAIANEFIQQNTHANVVYVTSEDFTNEYIESIQKNSMSKFRDKYRNCDLFIMDDIQGIEKRESTKDELENVFNSMSNRGGQMIFTSDRPINKLKDLGTRLRGRLNGGITVTLKTPSFETRKAILLDLAQKNGYKIDDKGIELIAEKIDHDVRELKSTLVTIAVYASFKKKEISIKLIKEQLSDKINIELPSDISVSSIQKAVAEYFGIKASDMKSNSKLQAKAHPRKVAMYIADKYTNNTSTELGLQFKKSHSTVLRSVQKIEEDIANNVNLKKDIDKILLGLSEY